MTDFIKIFGLCFVFLIITTNPTLASTWEFKKKYGFTEIYKSKNKSLLTLNYKTTVPKNKKFNKKFIRSLKKTKAKMLSMVGIKNWTVNKTLVKKRKNKHTELVLIGNYINHEKKKIYFTERHFYKNNSRLQLLFTNSNYKQLKKDDHKRGIAGFKIKYGY